MRRVLCVLCPAILWSFVLAAPASGQGQEATDQQAKIYYQKGVESFNAGNFAEAAKAFRQAYRLKPSFKIYYNIGQSEAAAKRYGEAWEAFELYLLAGGDEVPVERKDYVVSEIQRMKMLAGVVEVKAPDGLDVMVDGEARGTTPLKGPLRMTAGNRKVAVQKDGKVLQEKEISVIGGMSTSVEFQIAEPKPAVAAVVPPPPKPEPKPASEAQPKETEGAGFDYELYGWIGIGVGGAALLGGVVTGAMALSLNSDLKDKCSGGVCPPNEQSNVDKLGTLSTVSTVLVIGGGVIAAAGATLLIIDAVSGSGSESNKAGASLSPGPTGVVFNYRF